MLANKLFDGISITLRLGINVLNFKITIALAARKTVTANGLLGVLVG